MQAGLVLFEGLTLACPVLFCSARTAANSVNGRLASPCSLWGMLPTLCHLVSK